MNKDALQGYRPPENEETSESAGVVAARKLMEAKIGDTVEVTVKMLGSLALAYMYGIKPTYDEDGNISIDLGVIQVGSGLNSLTVQDTREYDSPSHFLYYWTAQVFMDKLRLAVTRALVEQKRNAFDQELASSFKKRASTSARYFREGMGYGDMASFMSSFRQSVRTALTGKTSYYDSDFTNFKWASTARESLESCFVIDAKDIQVHEGFDQGKKTLLATLKITKNGELPVSQTELEEFLYEMKY